MQFHQIPIDSEAVHSQRSGRPFYKTSDDSLFLYHGSTDDYRSGVGRWIVSRRADHYALDAQVIAHVDSWAILPHLIDSNDMSPVKLVLTDASDLSYAVDLSLSFHCTDADRTVYFHSSAIHRRLSGFYVQQWSSDGSELYSKIKVFAHDEDEFLFRLSGSAGTGTWLIGDKPWVDGGHAFVQDDEAEHADQISGTWKFLVTREEGYEWTEDSSAAIWSVINTHDANSISSVLQLRRALSHLPTAHALYALRNGLRIPQLGLGTGGIAWEDAKDVFRDALDLGYRLFDMAREYQNEHYMGELLAEGVAGAGREQLFLESKVWPTEFTSYHTTRAVLDSLEDLHTDYIDLYLLHWPSCDASISWMHCETTHDPAASSWRIAYKTLEKLYAEGMLMAIGVSNFDHDLLQAMANEVTVLPHVVQNYATIGAMDLAVRQYCQQHGILYQPYASMRNMLDLPHDTLDYVKQVAAKQLGGDREEEVYEVLLHCMLASGAVMIPRSSQLEHLRSNIEGRVVLPEDVLRHLGCLIERNGEDEL